MGVSGVRLYRRHCHHLGGGLSTRSKLSFARKVHCLSTQNGRNVGSLTPNPGTHPLTHTHPPTRANSEDGADGTDSMNGVNCMDNGDSTDSTDNAGNVDDTG